MNARVEIKPAVLRCAVYTRKSSEEGLEQSFNSLHAQRDACEAYIKSQVGEGWSCLPDQYDDGGISGGTMERPGLKRLLADIATGRIDVVVVYKVDRLTRSLGDFARIVEAFDKAGVSFVSVTQAFNTTTSMGRLTLNVLLSFAQFEREVTGERIRDKIALSKAKGMWMGGVLPLGYDSKDHILVPNLAEADTVRHIFQRYLKLGSVHVLCAELNLRGVRSKAWITSKGRAMGGARFSRGALFHLLQNRHYVGRIVHKEIHHPGLHAGIVDPVLFEAVQKRIAKNRVSPRKRRVKAAGHLLTGRLFDGEGRGFSPTFSTGRTGRIHRYYVATDIQLGREGERREGVIRRVGADALETAIVAELRRLSDRPDASAESILALLVRLELRPAETHLVLHQGALFGDDHPQLAMEDLQARLRRGERLVVEGGKPPALRIALPRRMQLRGGRTWVFKAEGEAEGPKVDLVLVRSFQRARALADRIGATPLSVWDRKLLQLAFLAPDLQRRILEGRHNEEVTLAALVRRSWPLSWSAQRAFFEEVSKRLAN